MGFAQLTPKALFGSVLRASLVGLWSVIYRTRQCKYVVIFHFTVIRYKRCCYPQGFNFFLQPRQLKLFLSQNFVSVSHARTLRNGVGNCGRTTLKNNRVRECQSSQPKKSAVS